MQFHIRENQANKFFLKTFSIMAISTNQELEQLKQQLEEKGEEIRAIYDKLMEAGVEDPLYNILGEVSGGLFPII